jgi:glycine/D-amino acid oxidase-like deaminating enzyme
MSKVVIIGCGVVGAAIAYELSLVPGLSVTVLDKQPPAQGATGAALGVLMGIISHKIKGKAWQLRQASMQRYESLIPELEAITGRQIPYNRQGILLLVPSFLPENAATLADWEKLVEIRQSQGWQLQIWQVDQIRSKCPQLNLEQITAAIYSPQDRQVDPATLTLALVEAAQRNGVTFQFGVTVDGVKSTPSAGTNLGICAQIQTTLGPIEVDWLVIAAGLGSTPLTASLAQPIEIKPVLGQALHLHLKNPLGNLDFQPAITKDDIHIVPLGQGEYWVGATVEFPTEQGDILTDPARLEEVIQKAIALCPALAEAAIIRVWSGLRPRPENRPAPVIGLLPGYRNVLLATGHYRNGILLAPATAIAIREAIVGNSIT